MKKYNLKEVYDKIAEKYYLSRNKHWSEGQQIITEIQKYGKKEISILEFGCGGGRCIKYLNENLKGIKINYTGIDISNELLKYAKKDNPNNSFICDNITHYIQTKEQEQYDFIIGIASFQHIEHENERLLLMKNFYKTLKYGGELIITNRSFSNRFSKKYKKEILKSIIKTIYTFGNHTRNNIFIPRKYNGEILYRFYHIFSIKELKILCKRNGFTINKLCYLDKNGKDITERKLSNNTILIGKKSL